MKRFLFAPILLLLLAFSCVYLLHLNRARICFDSYQQIKVGMTKTEVEDLLGPPRQEVRPKDNSWIDTDCLSDHDPIVPEKWWGREGIIRIWFKEEIVSRTVFCSQPCEVQDWTFWEKVCQWLGL